MTVEILHRIEKAISTRDIEAMVDCFSPGFESELPLHPAQGFRGRDGVRANYTAIFALLPDITARVLRHAAGDGEVWSEWEMRGTRADGVVQTLAGVVILRPDADGRAAAARFYLDPVDDSTGNPVTGA